MTYGSIPCRLAVWFKIETTQSIYRSGQTRAWSVNSLGIILFVFRE